MAKQSNQPSSPLTPLAEDQQTTRMVRTIIICAVILLCLAVGAIYYWQQKQQTAEAAAGMLAQAQKPEELQQVVDRYPNTAAAGSALLLQAAASREKQDFNGACELYARYLRQYANTPLSPAVQFAQAQCYEAAGKKTEAQNAYQSIINAKPLHPFAGGAAVALARMYKADNNISAARSTLTDFLARNSSSSYQSEANAMLRELSAQN